MNWKKIVAFSLGLCLLFCVASAGFLYWYRPKVPQKSKLLEKQITAFSLEDDRWNVHEGQEKIDELNHIFRQPFYYLGQGKQCTAYASKDGKYVLKFLLQKPLVVKSRFTQLPDLFPFTMVKKYKTGKRETRKSELFYAFMLSYQIIPEQTGFLYVHLNRTNKLFRQPLIVDIKGSPVFIDIDATQFVLQKRATHIKPVIIDLMWAGKTDEAKLRVEQVLMLLYEAAKYGIVDVDKSLIRNNNIGFLPRRAIYIDTGKLRLVKDRLSRKEFVKDLKRLKPFHAWLKTYYPELATHFEIRQGEIIETF